MVLEKRYILLLWDGGSSIDFVRTVENVARQKEIKQLYIRTTQQRLKKRMTSLPWSLIFFTQI